MKHTKENVVKLLKSIRHLNHEMKEHYQNKGDSQTANYYLQSACEDSFIIELLTDKKFFNTICKIHNLKDAD